MTAIALLLFCFASGVMLMPQPNLNPFGTTFPFGKKHEFPFGTQFPFGKKDGCPFNRPNQFPFGETQFPFGMKKGCPFNQPNQFQFGIDIPFRTETPPSQPPFPFGVNGQLARKPKHNKNPDDIYDYKDVVRDLKDLMVSSKEFWPADYDHYGPFFIRFAWHNAGSYRTSDGRGGADGARMRFDPERSWDDNTNLDKALTLLQPIKDKYGQALSWGDLFILSGNAAIESMGGPVLGFCGGRVDAVDGSDSVQLGPSTEQEDLTPCPTNGRCQEPLGTSTVGLIYVNPEGPMGNPDPEESARDIREVFSRMDMNDTETVALIGGGHTFGKSHGACPAGAGPAPKDDPSNPWPGLCGTGKGKDTYTSGIELPWTTRPTYWDDEYFHNLQDYDWHLHKGPGDKYQWQPALQNNSVASAPSTAPCAHGAGRETIGLLTTDVALYSNDEAYKKIVRQFAEDKEAFDHAFKHAWYKLTTRDMGPVTRCSNDDHPPAQDWQYPLPDPPEKLADFGDVKVHIERILNNDDEAVGMFTRLAWQSCNTFRKTDYIGGCNGARIRLSPQKDWSVNTNVKKALEYLEPVKQIFGASLSWADLIVLAGNTALEKAGGKQLTFCGGRTDATDGGPGVLFPRITGNFSESLVQLKDYIYIMGLSHRQFVALLGAGYVVGQTGSCRGLFCHGDSLHGTSSHTSRVSLSNKFFSTLLYSEPWDHYTIPTTGQQVYKAIGKDHLMLKAHLLLKFDPELLEIVEYFAADNEKFLTEVAAAWTVLVNADRFSGAGGNVCYP